MHDGMNVVELFSVYVCDAHHSTSIVWNVTNAWN